MTNWGNVWNFGKYTVGAGVGESVGTGVGLSVGAGVGESLLIWYNYVLIW